MGRYILPAIFEKSFPDLYREVKDRNLEQQYFLLQTAVEVGLTLPNYRLSPDVLYALQATASNYLDDTPGRVRDGFVSIENSKHVPSPPEHTVGQLSEYFQYINDNFETETDIHLAAYALWRLTWIHPFNECNGRTARTFCYLIICLKRKYWIPGEITIHALISENLETYYELLEEADMHYKESGQVDVSGLEMFLKRILYLQLKGTPPQK